MRQWQSQQQNPRALRLSLPGFQKENKQSLINSFLASVPQVFMMQKDFISHVLRIFNMVYHR